MGNTGRGGILLLSCALLLAPAAFADIYKYTDKHGRVYLTDTPKHSGYKRLVKTWKGWEEQKSRIALKDFDKNRAKFSPTIDYYAKQYQLPTSLLHAVVAVESAYDPEAVSKAGAVGLMQLMPETARRYGVANRTNPAQNVSGGSRYLRDLLKMFDNDLVLALAAYNAGENAVKRHGNRIPPFPETRRYVAKVLNQYRANRKAGAVAGR
jgi:soluble lytic murein transglycosylase-like protein